ncbi:MAG: GNAT family N-acetyltransferase [Rhizomicrobium sp.]
MKTDVLTHPCDVAPLAMLHAAAFDEAWSAEWIGRLMAQPGTFAMHAEGGFILVRSAGGEAEVLTLAVAPAARRRGIASTLILKAANYAEEHGARRLFLEVSDANQPAKSLYTCVGFKEVGRRVGYYQGAGGRRQDALVLAVELPIHPVGNLAQFD